MSNNKIVGFLILGCGGYMGGNALQAFSLLNTKLREEGIESTIFFCVDLDTKKLKEVSDYCYKTGSATISWSPHFPQCLF